MILNGLASVSILNNNYNLQPPINYEPVVNGGLENVTYNIPVGNEVPTVSTLGYLENGDSHIEYQNAAQKENPIKLYLIHLQELIFLLNK